MRFALEGEARLARFEYLREPDADRAFHVASHISSHQQQHQPRRPRRRIDDRRWLGLLKSRSISTISSALPLSPPPVEDERNS